MSTIRVLKDKKHPYLIMNKTVLDDNRLSFKATGLLVYFLSKPDDWTISYHNLIHSKTDGMRSIASAFKELITYGYICKLQARISNGQYGRYFYNVYEVPHHLNSNKTNTQPKCYYPISDKPNSDNSNKLINKNKKVIRKTTTTPHNLVNITKFVDADLNLHNQKTEVILLLNELKVCNHKKLFALFSTPDILSTAEWIKDNHCKMKNPTGFFIKATEENWKDSTVSDSGYSHTFLFYYKCLNCGNINGYINKIRNFDFCNKCKEK